MATQFYARYVPPVSQAQLTPHEPLAPARNIQAPEPPSTPNESVNQRKRHRKDKSKHVPAKKRLKSGNDTSRDEREEEDDFDVNLELLKLERKFDEHKSSSSSSNSSPEAAEHSRQAKEEILDSKKEKEGKRKKKRRAIEIGPDKIQDVHTSGAKQQHETEVSSTENKKKRKKERRSSKDESQPSVEGLPGRGDEEPAASSKHSVILGKFHSSMKRAELAQQEKSEDVPVHEQDTTDIEELHDLVPLPQPPVTDVNTPLPTYSVLPEWLAEPSRIMAHETVPFEQLPLHSRLIDILHKRGWSSALAIQAAILPLLLDNGKQHPGDVCVQAPTGSGKTLAYTLPMIEAIRVGSHYTRLRGLVIVPTKELVAQVREVAELCNMGLNIGTAVGSQSFATEQKALVRRSQRYDPQEAAELRRRSRERVIFGVEEDESLLDDILDPEILPGHIPVYHSKVDLLICTPGRLVEHMQSTHGFTLDDLEWLIIDEADRLLADGFQNWLSVVTEALEDRKEPETPFPFFARKERRVRKVVLSATMTQDLQKLSGLRLRMPKLVSLVTSSTGAGEGEAVNGIEALTGETSFDLPLGLVEWAVPVADASDKPLYLLKLLESRIASNIKQESEGSNATIGHQQDDSTMSSDSSSDSEADSDSDSASMSSDNSSDPSTNMSDSTSTASNDPSNASFPIQDIASSGTVGAQQRSVIVFVNTSENAVRLSFLLGKLVDEAWQDSIFTLTKYSSSKGRKALRAFRTASTSSITHASSSSISSSAKPIVLIATDRAARGLDLPFLTDVINYDMARSVTDYIHRVGRTARADRKGQAWTLVEEREAWFFWKRIVGGEQTRRRGDVKRVRIENVAESSQAEVSILRTRYENALASLADAVKQETSRAGGRG